MQLRHYTLQALLFAFVVGGCNGGGCGGCAGGPIPGGFPAESRVASAIQLRVTESAIAAVEEDPAAIVSTLLGQEELSIPVPASCGSDPEVCCPGGTPSAVCGPVVVDLDLQAGDLPRLEINPAQGARRIDVIVRARLNTAAGIPVRYSGVSCNVDVDTSAGDRDGISLVMAIDLPQDPDELTTRMAARDTTVDLEDDDVTISGGFLCGGVNTFLKGFVVGLLTDQITALIEGAVSEQGCVACPSGSTDECGAFADACTEETCMIGDRCEQRLGLAQRMTVASIFGGLSGGQLGSLDIYDVAGGYAETNTQGISMGAYSGALPFAEARDRCGPPALAPVPVSVAQTSFFQGNTRPDTGAVFGMGVGLHQQVFDHLAYALYESGALCLNIGANNVEMLTTDGLAPLLMPSITELLHGTNSPIVVGLRPQAPPVIKIGAGTTSIDESGETVIDEALLDVRMDGAEIDFFVMVDDQFVRTMTVSANIHLPINLEVNGLGEIEPVVGNIDQAFSDVRVTNSAALRETPADLEARIPVLLNLALGPLVGSLGSFALPDVGGLKVQIAAGGIVSIEDNSFIAIFADLDLSTTMAQVQTYGTVTPGSTGGRPSARLQLGGDAAGLEYSYRVDGGPWAPFTTSSEILLTRNVFEIPGKHAIAVRARRAGQPRTVDPSPIVLSANFGKPGTSYFHGSPREDGCSCASGGSNAGWSAGLLALLTALLLRRRRSSSLVTSVVLLGSLGLSAQACTCSGDPPACPDGCLEGEVERGPTGRYSSLDSDGERVVVAAYDEALGDLVLVERGDDGELVYTAIAGVPDDVPTYEPATYRGGVATPGPDQGLWTSVALHGGLVHVAFVDADTGSLHYAVQQEDLRFVTELVDGEAGLGGASYVSLSISSSGQAAIAYLASGLASPDTAGYVAELRVAHQSDGWQYQVVDVGPISCGGYCAQAEVCIAGESISECAAPSGDCAGACAETEACVDSQCVATESAPTIHDLPDGVGLFASLEHRGDDSMVLSYYDRILGTVKVAGSSGTGFAPLAGIGDPRLDLGMWLSMAVDSTGSIHLAFQDATGDRLMYARVGGEGQVEAMEVVDDGRREGEDRSHPVGASASILVDGDLIPSIVYQDGLTSDVDLARREQDSWTRSVLREGDRLDGFYLQASESGGQKWMSHYFYDRSQIRQGELEIAVLPQ